MPFSFAFNAPNGIRIKDKIIVYLLSEGVHLYELPKFNARDLRKASGKEPCI